MNPSIPSEVDPIVRDLLARLKAHHAPSAANAKLTQKLAVRLAEHAGMAVEELPRLRVASLLHDIGMIDVPAAMLGWAGELDAKQQAVVAHHTSDGISHVARLAEWLGPWTAVIAQHHEQPAQIDNSDLPAPALGVKIVAIASAYVAMTNERPFAPTQTAAAAILELISDPTFDTDLAGSLSEVNKPARRPATVINPIAARSGMPRPGSGLIKLAAAVAAVALLAAGANTVSQGGGAQQNAGFGRPEIRITTTTSPMLDFPAPPSSPDAVSVLGSTPEGYSVEVGHTSDVADGQGLFGQIATLSRRTKGATSPAATRPSGVAPTGASPTAATPTGAAPTGSSPTGVAPAPGAANPTSPPATSAPAKSPPATSGPTSPPATSPPATSPPATSPPATSPPQTAPPTTRWAEDGSDCVPDNNYCNWGGY